MHFMILRLLQWLRSLGAPEPSYLGTLSDLTIHFQRLLGSGDGWLRVELPTGVDHFLQFTAGKTIEINFPAFTPKQQTLAPSMREAFASAGVTCRETVVPTGCFLEWDVPADPSGVAILVERVLRGVFGADNSTELRFVGNGLPPPRPEHS